MKKLSFLMSCVLCFQFSQAHAEADNVFQAMDDAGDVVAVWQDYDSITGNAIIAGSIYTGTVWSPPTILSDITTESYDPIVTTNSAGNAVVGWYQIDNVNEVDAFYAVFASAPTATWALPAQRVSSTDDNVMEMINLSVSNTTPVTVVATYNSDIGSNDFISARANTALYGGTWGTPYTISAE